MSQSQPNHLLDLWRWLWAVGEERVHWRRYLLGAFFSSMICVNLAIAYMRLLPKQYTCEWSAILPGAGAETRVNIDSIGQAQSSSSSPFSDKTLSPKANYKEIALSRTVLSDAAKRAGVSLEEFGEPHIKLVDQASIIIFQVTAGTAKESLARSRALFDSFRARLDQLRSEEMTTRNDALRNNISTVEIALQRARKRLLDLETESGLASTEQYNQLVTSIEVLRREQANARASVAERASQFEVIRKELAIDPAYAAKILRASADPEIRSLSTALANAKSAYAEIAQRFGPTYPRVVDARNKVVSIQTELRKEMRQFDEVPDALLHEVLIDNERVLAVFVDLVQKHAEKVGAEARLAEIDQIMSEIEKRRVRLGAIAARLDDLQRDHMIANAVFSSALARLDASKSDHYGSYPIVQILSEPTLPVDPSSPRLIFAVIGAGMGTLLSACGWFFSWLHQWFVFELHAALKHTRMERGQKAQVTS